MATIRTAIMVQDSMSPALRSMSNACRILLNNFEDIRSATSNTVDIQSLKVARDELNNTDMILSQIEQQTREVNQESRKMPSNFNSATSSANGLLSKVKQIAVAVGGISLINKTVDLSDQVSSNRARLSLIVDDNGSVEDLENKIFAMANRTRSSYLDTTSVVSKLGILAGENFKNTDEMIAFTELMNKNFAIGGASIQEQTSAMYQLTQAMAAGKLQGDEFRSIMENAPLLAEAIANYTGKSKGELKELSSDGVITANIIKNAMFSAADEINNRYNKMPMTWSQIWTKMKNITIKALDPVLTKINELANNQQVQEMFDMFINGASLVAQAILELIEGIAWLIDVLEPFAPVILAVAAAFLTYKAYTMIAAAGQAILNSMLTGTISRGGLMMGALMAIAVLLAYLWFTNDKVAKYMLMAWDALVIGAMALKLGAQTAFYAIIVAGLYMYQGFLGVKLGMQTAFYMLKLGAQGLQLGFEIVCEAIVNAFIWMYNKVTGFLNKLGANFKAVDYVDFTSKTTNAMNDTMSEYAKAISDTYGEMNDVNGKISEYQTKLNDVMNNGATDIQNKVKENEATIDERVKHRNDWINGASDVIKDVINMDGFDFRDMYSGALGDIAEDTKKIADNSEISEEDLKYLIDIAERETINRFTTASVNISMTNNNNINEEQDIDGIVEILATKLEEELQSVADGVHV